MELIKALFYQKTKNQVSEKTGIEILAKHYEHFFDVLCYEGSEFWKKIKEYVGSDLLNKEYKRDKLPAHSGTNGDDIVIAYINKTYGFYFEMMFYISNTIFEVGDLNEFLEFVANDIMSKAKPLSVFSDMDDKEGFCEAEEKDDQNSVEIATIRIDEIFGKMNQKVKTKEV